MPAYNAAIQTTGNQLMLLNIVRLRYADTPYFLEISNVFAAPTLGAATDVTGTIGSGAFDNRVAIGAGLEYSQSPVIAYTPLAGEQFSRRLLEPVGVENVSMLFRAGWNPYRIFRLFAQRINNVWNAEAAIGPARIRPPPDFAKFERVARTLDRLEAERLIEVIAETRRELNVAGEESKKRFLIEFRLAETATSRPDVRQLLADLELDPRAASYFITNDRTLDPKRAIVVVTRPLIATLFYVSRGVLVPERDVARHVVETTLDESGAPFDWSELTKDLFVVHSSETHPEDAYLAVEYRNTWFYIRDDDVTSKDTFLLLQMLLAVRAGEIPQSQTPLTLPLR